MKYQKRNLKDFKTQAFELILKESLSILPNSTQPLTIIYDDDFLSMFNSLLKVITDWNIPTTFIFIPKYYQEMMLNSTGKKFFDDNNEICLPPQITGAVQNSKLILNFLNGDSKYSKIRGAIINLRKQGTCKMVHSPGITEGVLKLITKSPYRKIHKESELVAWALGNAHQCMITSSDKSGNEYFLSFSLDGWENEPFISSGKINDDSWGNIPPGESFCCPDLRSVNGQICINGSMPGYLLTPNDEIILEFTQGKLKNWICVTEKAKQYFEILKEDALRHEDDNWNSFAEFGIGLNPAIKKLVGNSLFDEKMAKTIHIAIGDNTCFGHGVRSFHHDDLVCIKPSVELDGNLIMNKGVLNMEIIKKWKQSILFEKVNINDGDSIIFHRNRLSYNTNMAQRILSKGDRKGEIAISDKNFKTLFSKFILVFGEKHDIKYSDLKRKFKKNEILILTKMISLFCHYKIVYIKSNEK